MSTDESRVIEGSFAYTHRSAYPFCQYYSPAFIQFPINSELGNKLSEIPGILTDGVIGPQANVEEITMAWQDGIIAFASEENVEMLVCIVLPRLMAARSASRIYL